MTRFFTLALLLLCTMACQKQEEIMWRLNSPDGNLQISFFKPQENIEEKELRYRVDFTGAETPVPLIESSPLGLRIGEHHLGKGMRFVSTTAPVLIDETYEMPTGKQGQHHNYANERVITFEHTSGVKVNLVARAYNDAVAFRYEFPDVAKIQGQRVEEEFTGFTLAQEGKAWIQPYDSVTPWTPAYEKYFMNGIAIGETSPNAEGWCFPALFEAGDFWLLLTEAGEVYNYFGAHLQPEAPNRCYTIRKPEAEEAMGTGPAEPTVSQPFRTPWRVIVVGTSLQTIVATQVVRNLNEPSAIANTDWIKPGRASWSWWSDHPSSKNFNSLKKFVDLAAEMGWEYSLVDANWNMMEGGDLEQLVTYADEKGVGLLVWYNSGGPHNEVTEEPRDLMDNAEARKAEFAKLQALGVKGIKVDFFQSDKPHIMQQYIDILRDAADYQLLVNFHGCTIPRGWSRTWPNLMTMESVRGAESYAFSAEYPEMAPWHNTILPVTRNVIGSMDYTPVTFSNQRYPHLTTYAHELALAVLFESGIQHLADKVEAYQDLPVSPKRVLSELPVAWDEVRYVSGTPGQDMVLARKSGDRWYVAGINGENARKVIPLSCSFLGEGRFEAAYMLDGDTPDSFRTLGVYLRATSTDSIPVAPYGGFLLELRPTRDDKIRRKPKQYPEQQPNS